MVDILEIWEGDPMDSCGCGCVPVRISLTQAQRIMDEIKRQNEAVEQLKAEFVQLKVERDMVNPNRPRGSYPDHVREILDIGGHPPLFFLNTKLVHSGTFPNYTDLRELVPTTVRGGPDV